MGFASLRDVRAALLPTPKMWRPRSLWLTSLAVCFAAYLLTAHYTLRVNDTDATNWPAWWFVRHGTFFLDGFHSNNPWFVHAGVHIVSNRMGGVILFGLPMQAVFMGMYVSANAVGALTAALTTSIAMANMAVVFRRLEATVGLALGATACLALGTGMWTVSSTELWTHTANVFWLSCALLALTYNRTLVAGILVAPVIPTRPHLVVVIAILGLWLALHRRSWRVLLHFAVPALVSLAGLLAWNTYMYGTSTIGGGYAGHENALTGSTGTLWPFIRDIAGTVGSPLRGIILYTPLIVIAALCIPAGWRRAPDWAKATFVGGFVYQVVQLRLNRYSGGTAFYSNRLVLEMFLLATPLVVLGYKDWRERSPHRATVTRALTAASIGIHALGAFLPRTYFFPHEQHWTTWGPVAAVRYETGPAIAIIVATVIAGTVVTVWPLLRRRTALAAEPAPAFAAAGAVTPG